MDDEKLDKLVDSFYLIGPLFRKTLFHHKKFLKQKSRPPSQYRVLRILKKRGAIPMSEIGRKVYISTSNMTSLIDRLVEEGLAERLPDKNDRRVINIAITEKGKEVVREWRKHENEKIRLKLAALSDEDLEKLYESIETIKIILYKIRNN
jgi:MarR family transcriptional regulator, 2-MHQ and catechol-resistance regulon repressor